MSESHSIAQRLREVLLQGHWIANTNFKAQIERLNLAQAIQKTGNLNSVAALTYHVLYYVSGLLKVLQGGPLDIRDQYSFDLPPLDTEAAWKDLVAEFLAKAEALACEIEKMPDEKLEAPFVEPRYGTYRRNLDGLIEHSYYHLGQVVWLQKLLATAKEPMGEH